jgi:hypothetical protein
VGSFAASLSRGVLPGSSSFESPNRTAGSIEKAIGVSTAMDRIAKAEGSSINVEPEAGNVDGLESPSIVFSELSGENPFEITGNNSDCPNVAEDWCRIVVAKNGVDGLLTEYRRLSCSRDSEIGFTVSTEGKGCGISLSVG